MISVSSVIFWHLILWYFDGVVMLTLDIRLNLL